MPIVFLSLMLYFFFFSIFIVINIVIISIHFFVYLFIPLSPSSELSLLLQSVYIFFRLFIPLIFSHRVPSNLFQKLILHIFEKRKKVVSEQACLLQAGRLLSLHRNSRRMAVYQS